jgi:hypothetical protein
MDINQVQLRIAAVKRDQTKTPLQKVRELTQYWFDVQAQFEHAESRRVAGYLFMAIEYHTTEELVAARERQERAR